MKKLAASLILAMLFTAAHAEPKHPRSEEHTSDL